MHSPPRRPARPGLPVAAPGPVLRSGLLLAAAFLLAAPARGQEELLGRFGPRARELGWKAEGQVAVYPDRGVKGQGTDLGRLREEGSLSLRAPRGSGEWSPAVQVSHERLDTGARLRGSGAALPEDLWDVKLGLAYRHFHEAGRFTGASASVSSPSDEPFGAAQDVAFQIDLFHRRPASGRDAWLFFLNYANQREFLNHVPLPGFAYWYQPAPETMALLGFPFLFGRSQLPGGVEVSGAYLFPRTVRAQVGYDLLPALEVSAGFRAGHRRYLRAGREDAGERLFSYEKAVTAGLRYKLGDGSLAASAGYAFDRYYFEGEDFDDRQDDRIGVRDGPFVQANVGWNW